MRLRVNDDGPAIEFLEKAIALAPQDAESTYQLGALLYRNNLDEARSRALLRRAFELRPDYADPMYALARIESQAQNQAAALRLLERAVKLAPEQESIRYLLARTLQQLGRTSEAAAQFAAFRRLADARRRAMPRLIEEPALPLEPAQ
jgi:tetratricopeptide (TPR) repeat protein